MIEITNLTKTFGKRKAVDDISFRVEKGEVVGFLGPNGAGKTTTMSMITGFLSYTEGSIKVDGLEVVEHPDEVKKKIGYLPEQPPLYLDMTVTEYLDFVYQLKKATAEKNRHLREVMDMVRITDVRGRLIRNLSKGYKQRVGLAQALIGNPEILILDEPTVGLDPKQIIEIRNVIKELGKQRTVILSSHILPEVSAVCERVVIINKGKIVAEDTTENLSKSTAGKMEYTIRICGDRGSILSAVSSVEGVKQAKELGVKEPGTIDVVVTGDQSFDFRRPLFNVLAQKGLPIYMMKSNDMSLEDIFIKLTQDSAGAAKKAVKREVKQNEGNL